MTVPNGVITLMMESYKKIFPAVHKKLAYWKSRAEAIPNDELRKQALLSIKNKQFHCEGGAVLSLPAGEKYDDVSLLPIKRSVTISTTSATVLIPRIPRTSVLSMNQ